MCLIVIYNLKWDYQLWSRLFLNAVSQLDWTGFIYSMSKFLRRHHTGWQSLMMNLNPACCLFQIQQVQISSSWSLWTPPGCEALMWDSTPPCREAGKLWPGWSVISWSSPSLSAVTLPPPHRGFQPNSALLVTQAVWSSLSATSVVETLGWSSAPFRGRMDQRQQSSLCKVRSSVFFSCFYTFQLSACGVFLKFERHLWHLTPPVDTKPSTKSSL